MLRHVAIFGLETGTLIFLNEGKKTVVISCENFCTSESTPCDRRTARDILAGFK